MMKHLIFFATAFSAFFAQAQFTGKPIYNIRVERADTLLGNIEVELFPNIAPLHAANWDSIVTAGGYDSSAFHRVVPGFVIQGGDPNSISGPTNTWGQGDPNQANVDAEFSEVPHARGILSAARSNDINSASSQFFLCHQDAFTLDNNYTVYGNTISGMNIVDIIVNVPTASGTERPEEKVYMIVTKIGSNDSIPDSPSLIAPTDAVTGTTSNTTFSWSSVSQAHLYLFEIATDVNFSNIIFSKETKNTSAKYIELADGYTTHYWRVRANNGGNYSTSGDVRTFESGIGTTTLLLPEDGSDTGSKPYLDWSDVDQISEYHLLVSTSSSFGNPNSTIMDTVVGVSFFKFSDDLLLNFTHYWKVTALDSDGNMGDYTYRNSFRATELTGVNNEIDQMLNIYPNPFKSLLTIVSEIEGDMLIIDLQGKLLAKHPIYIGDNNINLSSLKNGLYYYSIENSKGNSKKGKMSKN